MLAELSAVIITRDAAATLALTLDALKDVDEVVVYDNGSTDGTLELAARYANVALHRGEFYGFGPTKRHAVSLARHDWVVSLDADETPSADWLEALAGWLPTAEPRQVVEVYRENWMLGKPVRHAGWGNDWLVRVFHRGEHNLSEAMVHESVTLEEATRVARLDGCLEHQAVTELAQLLEKVNRYSEIRARSDKLRVYPVALIMLKAVFAFFRTYLLRRGFLDGWRGLVIAVANANGVFWKYMKRRVRHLTAP